MKKTLATVILLLLVTFVVPSYGQTESIKLESGKEGPEFRLSAEYITASQLRDYLTFIAADELEGRDTPSRGLDIAAKFIAAKLARWGYTSPPGKEPFFQPITLQRDVIDSAQSYIELDGQRFNFKDDFIAEPVAGSASAELVYAGNGLYSSEKGINDYENIEVKDRIILYSYGYPKGVTARDFPRHQRGKKWENASTYASKHGAKAAIALPSMQGLVRWGNNARDAMERGRLTIPALQDPEDPRVPAITASPRLITSLFNGEPHRGEVVFGKGLAGEPLAPFHMTPSRKLQIKITTKPYERSTQNVVAVLEGSDPTLNHEYVALGAHYDHVGIGPPVNGDSIYNGADDDGSGTVALLAMAEAFARAPRPKRSLLFVWHSGEEKGLLGSKYFTTFPVVPLGQIIAQINIDMIGRSKQEGDTIRANRDLAGPDEVYVVGSDMMSTDLGRISRAVNSAYLNLTFNTRYDDLSEPSRFFFRSDHYNYAQKGIPVIFYFTGTHADYHKPSDEVDLIDFKKMEKIARTIFGTVWELANGPSRPIVDKTPPEEFSSR